MGTDALMLKEYQDQHWLYRVKEAGMITATASLGLIHLWDVDCGLANISEYLDLSDGFSKQGALIGIGMMNLGIRDEIDPAKAILEENINSKEFCSRLGGIIGLGFAYAGSCREDFLETLVPFVVDVDHSLDQSVFAALSLGLIFCGDCNEDAATAIIETLMCRDEA